MSESSAILEEWRELSEDFKNLENTNKIYLQKLEEISSYQKECEKQIQHQKYRMRMMSKNPHTKVLLQDEILKREAQLHGIQQTLPKDSELYLKIILGNVNVSILNKEDKLKYKSDYEKFKLILSVVAFVLAVLNLMFVFRLFERLYLFVLVWYYCTLTVRESILKVNGSKIKGWWRLHHFISTVTAAILLIWPESRTWDDFRNEFMVFNAYLSVVQYLQFRYQSGVLYRLKALGERHNMDITIEGFHHWMWKGLSFLFPFLFAVYFFQLHISYVLYKQMYYPGSTWHVRVLSLLFFVLAGGNIVTMLMVVPNKVKNFRYQYQVLSQKFSSWNSYDGTGASAKSDSGNKIE